MNLENITEFIEELQGFIYWFNNSIFDKKWMINKFLEILRLLNGSFEGSHYILENLMDYIVDYPNQVIDCLDLIIKNELRDGYLLFEEKSETIFKDLVKLENEEVNVSKETFNYIDYRIWKILWQWCLRRHKDKGKQWIRHRYFMGIGKRTWIFGERKENVLLFSRSFRTGVRYTPVKGYSSPYDSDLHDYWRKRYGKSWGETTPM